MEENKINGKSIKHFYLEKDGVTYTEKSPEMKLQDGLITAEEYNIIIKEKRENLYKSKTDNMLLDFISFYLEARKDTLSKTELELLTVIEAKKQTIKDKYKKV